MSRRSGLVLLVLAVICLGLLLVLGIVFVLPTFSSRTLPTALALPPTDTQAPATPITPSATASPTETPTVTAIGSQNALPTEAATVADNATLGTQESLGAETTTPEDTVVAAEVTETSTATSSPTTQGVQDTVTSGPTLESQESPTSESDDETATFTPIDPTTSPPETDVPPTEEQPTAGASQAASVTPSATPRGVGSPTLTPTVSNAPGAALQTLVNVSNGEMMVVSTAFPATDTITGMGVTPPAPPDGTAWLLVEALMKCNPNVNCTPPASSIRVLGSSGTYDPTTAFSIAPSFNSQGYTSGQVWGYLEFAVPTTEQNLRLSYTLNKTIYVFALQ